MTTTALTHFSYGIRRDTTLSFEDAVARTRTALQAQGFGVLTEIDVTATLKAKLGIAMDPYIILGACNPPLAHRAIEAQPEIGLLLPCNVVVRKAGDTTVVEAMDPEAAMGLVKDEAVHAVALEAKQRLIRMLEAI